MKLVRSWSTRVRLMLWYGGVLMLTLALLGLVTYSLLEKDLIRGLDQRLAEKTNGVRTLAESEPEADLAEELGEFASTLPQGQLLEVATDSGDLLVPQNGRPVFPDSLLSSSGAQTFDSGRFRVFVTAFEIKGHKFTVLTAESMDEIRRLMGDLQAVLYSLFVPALLVTGLGGYWLSGRALAPVDAMTRAARSISVDSLSQRLPEPRTGDEIERLAKVWNELLERLEASVKRIQRFTADASHELRTPVALIRSTAELALRRERSPADYRDALRQIELEAQRMTELAESLLELARADASLGQAAKPWMPLTPVDLSALVTEVAGQSGPVAKLAEAKGVQLEAGFSPAPALAEANPAGIRRLLLILVDNAVEHTPSGGRVVVSVSRNNGRVNLSVKDSGDGISANALPHIFERFYRADEARGGKGAGLGLSIAQVIAQAHGSEIEVESTPGQGACFRLALRAAGGEEEHPGSSPR